MHPPQSLLVYGFPLHVLITVNDIYNDSQTVHIPAHRRGLPIVSLPLAKSDRKSVTCVERVMTTRVTSQDNINAVYNNSYINKMTNHLLLYRYKNLESDQL